MRSRIFGPQRQNEVCPCVPAKISQNRLLFERVALQAEQILIGARTGYFAFLNLTIVASRHFQQHLTILHIDLMLSKDLQIDLLFVCKLRVTVLCF